MAVTKGLVVAARSAEHHHPAAVEAARQVVGLHQRTGAQPQRVAQLVEPLLVGGEPVHAGTGAGVDAQRPAALVVQHEMDLHHGALAGLADGLEAHAVVAGDVVRHLLDLDVVHGLGLRTGGGQTETAGDRQSERDAGLLHEAAPCWGFCCCTGYPVGQRSRKHIRAAHNAIQLRYMAKNSYEGG